MLLKLEPIYTPKIWGGLKFNNYFTLPTEFKNKKIGEAWLISAYPKKENSILNNKENLNTFYQKNKKFFNNYPSKTFPLLAKLIIAETDLSIQVHPNNDWAKKLENYPLGKEECWYIIDTFNHNKEIILGLNPTDKKTLSSLIKAKKWTEVFKKIKIKKDQSILVRHGMVHAILGGTVLYELQQSSDITYRIYDYDRKDENNKLRKLDLEKSLKVIEFNNSAFNKSILIQDEHNFKQILLINSRYFNLEKWIIKKTTKTLSLDKALYNFLLITCIEGEGKINNLKFKNWESFLVSADELKALKITGNCTLLVGNPK